MYNIHVVVGEMIKERSWNFYNLYGFCEIMHHTAIPFKTVLLRINALEWTYSLPVHHCILLYQYGYKDHCNISDILLIKGMRI